MIRRSSGGRTFEEETPMPVDVPDGSHEHRAPEDHDVADADSAIHCSECGSSSPATRKFCSSCGASLWDACFQCGELVSSSEKFCGACGADLTAGLDVWVERIERDLLEAQRLELDSSFDEAIALLEPIAELTHSRMSGHARQAKGLLAHLHSARDRGRAHAEAALEEAQQCLTNSDYETAVRLLEEVAPSLRSKSMESELAAARAKLEEIETLGAELRAAIAAKKGGEMLEKVSRLLELQPQHAQALGLARQLRERLCRTAAERLKQHKYDEAIDLLGRVPEAVQTPDVAKLRGRAAELAFLDRDLRTAPFVDEGLLAAARRMQKVAPDDPKLEKLLAELRARVRRAQESPCLGPAVWATPTKRTLLGPPIDWVTGFRHIQVSPAADVATLRAHPGCFFVACGLALQGLGKAAVRVNLQPAHEGGLLSRARRVMRKPAGGMCWGIDVSPGGVKAVKLAVSEKGRGVTLEACELVEHRKILSQAVNEAKERELIDESIGRLRARRELKSQRVCLGLPGMMALCRQVRLPPMPSKKVPEVMRYEARLHLPYDPADLVWGYQVMDTAGDREGDAPEREVLLVAVRREPLKRHVDKLQSLNTDFDVIQCDPLALHNLVAYEHLAGDVSPEGHSSGAHSIAVLDAGADGTNFVVSTPQSVWFRTLGVGGHSFSKALVRELKVTLSQAEKVKRDPGQAPRMSDVNAALEPVFKDFVNEAVASLGAHSAKHGRKNIERILALGGAFQTHGLLRFLRTGQ